MRRRLPLLALLTIVTATVATESSALAQKRPLNNPGRAYGVGVGMYSGPLPGAAGPYNGPYYGAFPLYYRGFYGNGMSMYGPPVATYGPIPGTFGGSDYRLTQNAPFFGTNLGWLGSRSPSPRPIPNLEFNPPAFANDGEPRIEPIPDGKPGTPMIVEVRVPLENAIVFVNGEVTKQMGNVRKYASPPLKGDEVYQYDVRAEWIIDGKRTSLTKRLTGKPGETVVADFMN